MCCVFVNQYLDYFRSSQIFASAPVHLWKKRRFLKCVSFFRGCNIVDLYWTIDYREIPIFCFEAEIKVTQVGSYLNFELSEAATERCSVKKVFLEILQNSQENTCAIVSFNKIAGLQNF